MSIPTTASPVRHRIHVEYSFPKHGLRFEKDLFFEVKNTGNWQSDETVDALRKKYPQVIALQNGVVTEGVGTKYDGTADTYLYSTHPVHDRNTDFVNYGEVDHFLLGRYAYKHRPLFRFDLSALPATARVAEAYLKIFMYRQRGKGPTAQAFKILRKWSEGRGTGSRWTKQAVLDGEASWLCSSYPERWNIAGCDAVDIDRAGEPSGTALPPTENKSWITIPLATSLVQEWLKSPGANNGVILIDKDEAKGYSSAFRSSEFADTFFRPKLILALKGTVQD